MTTTLPRITVVRHGETEWSANGKHTSRTELPLTPRGVEVARTLAARLNPSAYQHVFSSPRLRARHTAELAGFPTPTILDDLREWDYGDYEGQTTAEIRQTHPHWELFRDGCPGGESVEQATVRFQRLANYLKSLEGEVICFGHGHATRVLAACWVGQLPPFARCLLLGTATIGVLSFDHHNREEPAIAAWNAPPGGWVL
jgi:probable phosphoglycerate mutase